MKKTLFILYLILHSSITLGSNNTLIEKAEYAYKNKNYKEAQNIYTMLRKQYPQNPNILYNLGNTHFKLKNTGYAIAYYLKALKISPSNKDYSYNLNLAREFVEEKTATGQLNQKIINKIRHIPLNTSFYIFISIFTLFLVSLKLLTTTKYNKEILLNTSVSLFILLLASTILFSYLQYNHSLAKGVIIEKKVAIHSGPSETLPILFYIHEGHECKIKKETENWEEIELPNGFTGWSPSKSLLRI